MPIARPIAIIHLLAALLAPTPAWAQGTPAAAATDVSSIERPSEDELQAWEERVG